MREGHLHLLALVAHYLKGLRLSQCTDIVTGILIDVAWNFSLRCVGAASVFQRTGTAVFSPGQIAKGILMNVARRL